MTGRLRLAWLGLGGNIGDVAASMREALSILDATPGIRVAAVSALYATPPWGREDQPDFLNAAAQLETTLSTRALLDACLAAELALRRVRNERWGPRTIDLDILAMEGVEVDEPGLQVPHPRLHERAFALLPLAGLAPGLEVSGRSVAQWLERLDTGGIHLVAEPDDWWREAGARK